MRSPQSTAGSVSSPDAGEPASAKRFREIYEAEFSYVWHSLRRMGVRGGDLEDLAHDVFVTAYRRHPDYDPTRPIRPWLFGIAFRTVADFRRRAHHSREVLEDEPTDVADGALGADDRIAAQQDKKLLMDALDTLDDGKRAVFVMHELNGHSAPEIALALDLPLNTAYSRLRLARAEVSIAVKRLVLQRGGVR